MLNSLAIGAALPLAQRLDERKLRVMPAEGTPLMSLFMATENSILPVSTEDNPVEHIQRRSGLDLHRVAKDDIVSLAAESISRLLNLAHGTALPHIKELTPVVQAAVSRRRVEAVLPYCIEMREIPVIYSNVAIKALIDKYPVPTTTQYATRELYLEDIDAVKELTKTGMAGVDAEMDLALSLENDEGYAQIMEVLAGRRAPVEVKEEYLPGLLVAAAAIYNEPGRGINMSLVDYNAAVNALIGVTCKLTRAASVRFEQLRKANVLYSPTRKDIATIVVMGEVYRDMLNKGLTPEALIGNEMSGRRFSQGQLIENKDALEKIYHREMNLRQLKVQSEMVGITVQELRSAVIADMRARDVEDMEDKIKELDELIKFLSNNVKIDDIAQLVTICVCKMHYAESDVLTFIQLMNHVGELVDGDTDPREIALMAAFKYVNRWLCGQLGLIQA